MTMLTIDVVQATVHPQMGMEVLTVMLVVGLNHVNAAKVKQKKLLVPPVLMVNMLNMCAAWRGLIM